MKAIRNVCGLALVLCTSGAGFEAHACGVGFSFCVPFLSFGIGLGLGAPCAGPAYGCAYGYPAYTYAQPAYACAPPASYIPPVAAAPAAPAVAETPVWMPSTPGPGHWVPNPEPYNYVPGQTAGRPNAAGTERSQTTVVAPNSQTPDSKLQTRTASRQTVSISTSPGGVPVYFVSR
jgi:hypothetical protein